MKLFSISTVVSSIAVCIFSTSCAELGVSNPINPNSVGPRVDPITGKKVYPVAKPLLDENGQPKKGYYISPYYPYNPIEAKGYSSGELVGDPSTAQMNQKTGKNHPFHR